MTQEIAILKAHFGGSSVFINPNDRSPVHVPRLAFGFHRLRQIRALEKELQLHHLFNPDPFAFPVLRLLRRPTVYSLTAGVSAATANVGPLSSLAAVTVADERSHGRLTTLGLENVKLVRPGVDASGFSHTPLPLHSEIRLMVGSAPWMRSQFRTKGIDALLQAARQSPRLHLTFLWRGVLADEMQRRVRRLGLERQVTVVNRRVDVNKVLAGVHASIALATDPAIIYPYPHSLIESLAAGKPVLVSQSIPMADYVARKGCGKVVEHATPESILSAIEAVSTEYGPLQQAAQHETAGDFAVERLVSSFRQVYEQALGHPIRGRSQ